MIQAKKPELESLRATYVQDADTCDAGLGQELIIESHDGGSGMYYTLETSRWAFDNVKELTDIINDFFKRTKP